MNLVFVAVRILIVGVLLAAPEARAEISIVTPEIHDQILDEIRVENSDLKKYRNIFEYIEKGDFVRADKLIAKLDSQILLGYVLAEKYLHSKYKSSKEELEDWMDLYRDHPMAAKIFNLAQKKGSDDTKEPVFAGDGDDAASSKISLKYLERLAKSDRLFLVRQAKKFRAYIRNGKTLAARKVLENKRFRR